MFQFIQFEIWIFQTIFDDEMIKINFLDIEKLWNVVVRNFWIWSHLVM
jgi:hypothetical protein